MVDPAHISKASDAAAFVDAKLNIPSNPDWFDSVRRHRLFRLYRFSYSFAELDPIWRKSGFPSSLKETLVAEAKRIAAELVTKAEDDWCSGIGYSAEQLTAALGGKPMKLDRALLTVLAFNALANKSEVPHLRLEKHCITACAFRFAPEIDLEAIILRAAREYFGRDDAIPRARDEEHAKEIVESKLAEAANQQTSVVRELIYDTRTPADKTLKAASYPTVRAIYKALMMMDTGRTEFPMDRVEIIHPRNVTSPNMIAHPNEALVQPSGISRPPYNWRNETDETKKHPANLPEGYSPFGLQSLIG